MALTYIACFLLFLQVVSANHISITPSQLPTIATSESDMFDINETTTDIFSSTEQAVNATEETKLPEELSSQATTDLEPLDNVTTTETTNFVVITEYYSTEPDLETTEVPTLKPTEPTKGLATVMSQPGLLVLLPVAARLVSLSWCR